MNVADVTWETLDSGAALDRFARCRAYSLSGPASDRRHDLIGPATARRRESHEFHPFAAAHRVQVGRGAARRYGATGAGCPPRGMPCSGLGFVFYGSGRGRPWCRGNSSGAAAFDTGCVHPLDGTGLTLCARIHAVGGGRRGVSGIARRMRPDRGSCPQLDSEGLLVMSAQWVERAPMHRAARPLRAN
jgi:hypothetical protein